MRTRSTAGMHRRSPRRAGPAFRPGMVRACLLALRRVWELHVTAAGTPSTTPPTPPRKKWLRRLGIALLGALGAIAVGLAVVFFTPPVTQASSKAQSWWGHVVGVDLPVEIKYVCAKPEDLVSPPREKDAAYHYRCKGSSRTITRQQIAKRCALQWGTAVKLVLRDRDMASGWKCHQRGWLR
jgi:hypothetical protein